MTDGFFEYNHALYVTRKAYQKQLTDWLAESAPKKLLRSLVGPPGVGKSWLLRNLYETEREQRFALWIDASKLAVDDVDMVRTDLIRKANQYCPGIDYPEHTSLELPRLVEDIGPKLYNRCPSLVPLILVDGFDDVVSSEDIDKVQRDYLRPFFTPSCPNYFRMVIARRGKLRDKFLSKKEEQIFVSIFDEKASAMQQIDKIEKYLQADASHQHRMRSSFKTYSWNHPFINTFLVQSAINDEPVSASLLKDCCLRLINRPRENVPSRHPSFSSSALDELVMLAIHLPAEWDGDQFKKVTGKRVDSLHEYLTARVVMNLESLTGPPNPKYCIADGLRELLKELSVMQDEERKS